MNTVIVNGVNITEEIEKLKITNDSLLVVNTNLAKELNELKRDVARFLNLMEKPFTNHFDEIEYRKLKEKLMKVGKEE